LYINNNILDERVKKFAIIFSNSLHVCISTSWFASYSLMPLGQAIAILGLKRRLRIVEY